LLNVSENPIFVIEMKKGLAYSKLLILFLLVLAGHFAFGTGSTEKSSRSNFTLKNVNKNKTSLTPVTGASYKFKGTQFLSVKKEKNNTIQVNSVMRYQNGNTTYVFPYKYKVKAPLFKAPAAPSLR
jgi:hypothetical protein